MRVLVVVFVALASSQRSRASAQELDDERAHAHYLAGESHFAAEHWADAAREFQQAHALSHRPEMLINLSRAHERGGQLAEAIADLDLLLESYPETSYQLEAEQRATMLRAKLAAPVPPPIAEPPPVAELPSSAEPPPVSSRSSRWPTVVVGSVALAVGAAALGTGLRAHGLHGDLEERCPADRCTGEFESDRDKGRALSRASTGLMFSSIALAGVTAALWVIDARRDKRVQVGLSGSSAQLRVRF